MKSIEINKISIENQEKSMPAAMESSQNIENPLETYMFSSNFFEMFFFFWKSRKISPDLENLLRDLAGRARKLSARHIFDQREQMGAKLDFRKSQRTQRRFGNFCLRIRK